MNAITFQTVINGEQVIRLPVDVVLPEGMLEVTVKLIGRATASAPSSRDAANARLRQCRVSIGRVTGIDNEGIDADLARIYGDGLSNHSAEALP